MVSGLRLHALLIVQLVDTEQGLFIDEEGVDLLCLAGQFSLHPQCFLSIEGFLLRSEFLFFSPSVINWAEVGLSHGP